MEPVPRPTPSPSPPSAKSVLVYYLVDGRDGLRLAREPHPVQKVAGTGAVEAMIAGPDDPDYTSPWNRSTAVHSVTVKGPVVTVDLSGAARTANVGSAGAELMMQQLVYTVTEVLGHRRKVRLLVDGKPAGELWGAVSWDQPVGRADPVDVRQVVQIDTPSDGASVASPVHVAGDADAFEANVPWRVLADDGRVVKSGHTATAEGFVFSPYAFDIKLKPGKYSIEIVEDNPSAAGQLTRDTRRVTVRG